MITAKEILMGRDEEFPLTKEQWWNLCELLAKLNTFRALYGKPLVVSSGYRPPPINAQVGGSPNSAHLHCQAVDFKDENGDLARWILAHQYILKQVDLYMEDPKHTLGWVHLQTRPVKNRVFVP